ncbi:AMP-binding protein [Sphingosinicella terrae]|uniref:AMP-binding protein n=1 Tax=Sphingosinicella terrae TaxID=2172047 RepID=UPI000E0DF727|nr:AMP-binding protein [Sphingosinicella terrae]
MLAGDFDLDANARLSARGLAELQLERLRQTLVRARGNPFYRTAFAQAGLEPERLDSLEALAGYPFTVKDDLRAGYPYGFLAVPREKVARLHASSGTTGQPTIVGYTGEDIATWAGLVARSIKAAGGAPGMIVQVAYGYGLFTGGLGAHYGAEALGCTVIPMSGGQTEKQVQMIEDLRPDILMVTPSYALSLLDALRARGIDPAGTSLRIGIFGAEPWTEAMRAEIEGAFGLRAVDIYGLSEVMGPGVAQEYGDTQDGLTLWEDHFYPEIVDPETGEPLPAGCEGELVLTSLTRQAMPVIRYRTRDLTRLLPGTHGPMRRMARIGGRSDDMMIVRGVNVFPSQIEAEILKCRALAPHFLIELSRPGRLDEVRLRVEARDGCGEAERAAAARELAGHVKGCVGISVSVQVGDPGTIERSTGKAKRVDDRRGE